MTAIRRSDGTIIAGDDDVEPCSGCGHEVIEVDGVELRSPEPPMVAVLRLRQEDRKTCTVHLLDRSVIPGVIEGVAEDGLTACIHSGRDEYTFDVAAVVVVQTAHRPPEGIVKAGSKPK